MPTLALLHITPYITGQAFLALSFGAVGVVVVAYTRRHRELWANRIKQASYFSAIAVFGIIMFWVVQWLLPGQQWLGLVAGDVMHLGVFCVATAVAWHVGTNLVVTANRYFLTLLCKSVAIVCALGLAVSLVVGVSDPFPMLGIHPVGESAFVYRWAVLIPELFAGLLILLGFAGEYIWEPEEDSLRKKRQWWFAAGSASIVVLVVEHLAFSYLQTYRFELVSSTWFSRSFVATDSILYMTLALTWIRAMTIELAEKSRMQQKLEASLRQRVHEVSISREYVDLCDLYSDWPTRAETLMLAVVVHSHQSGIVPQEKAAVAILADIHLRQWREESSPLPEMDRLLEKQQSEIRAASGLFYESPESEEVIDRIFSGREESDLSFYPAYVQFAFIAASYHGLLPPAQAAAIISGKLVEPYLVKIYGVAMEEMVDADSS